MKKNFTLKSIVAILMLFCVVSSYSQDRTCGMLEYMEEMLKDPKVAKQYERDQAIFKAEVARRLSSDFQARGASIVIPVAVHFPSANEADRDCLVALAQNQIDILNDDYSAMNADFAQWSAASANYPNTTAGAANIQFCLAVSNHPVGADPELLEGEPAVTIGYNFANGSGFPEFDTNFEGYMNFLVKDIGGALGYSPKGGSVENGMAVVLNTFAFGSGPGCPGSGIVPNSTFGLGRTTTHELGHFYNLDHPWGPANATCTADDGLADTPNTGQETYGCPFAGSLDACVAGEKILSMNYMDYVDDACMYMFTANQVTVMESYVFSVLQPQFVTGVCTPAGPGFNITASNSPIFTCPSIDTQAVFNLDYATFGGFNETTTFTAVGAPVGATVVFSPATLDGDGSFTMTVGNLGATAQGEYTITVSGTSSPGAITNSADVLLKNTCTEIACDTYASPTNLNLPITDGQPGGGLGSPFLSHVITVSDQANIESMTVTVDVSHTYIQDLVIQLLHPDGSTFVTLWNRDCVGENDLVVTFDDTGVPIVCAEPTVGTFLPADALSTFNGLDMQGDWTLFIGDYFAADTGQLNSWSIEICSEQSLSTEEFSVEDFSIFPNPNQGEFTVKLNSASSNDITIDVFDIRGRRIFNNSYVNDANFSEVVKLNTVQSGMYLVSVSDGEKKTTKKIIID